MTKKNKHKVEARARQAKFGGKYQANLRHVVGEDAKEPQEPIETLATDDEAEMEQALAYDHAEFQRYKDMLESVHAPIKELTALRDAVRHPLADITRIANHLAGESPFREIREMQTLLKDTTASPFREIREMQTLLKDAGVPKYFGDLAERLNKSPLMDAMRLGEQVGKRLFEASGLEKVATSLGGYSTLEAFAAAKTPYLPMGSILDRIEAEPKIREPMMVSPYVVRDEPPPPPPAPEVIDVDIQPHCQRCGNPLKGDLALEPKAWSGPGKIRGELHVEVCEECVRKAGGDPAALPRSPKRPTD